jgi:hypothetical protein
MRVMVVGSPHSASTRDRWVGVMKGFALNGIDVKAFDVFPLGEFFSNLVDYVREHKIPTGYLREVPSPMTLAYAPTFMAAFHHEVDAVCFVSPQYLPMEIPALLRKNGIPCWAVMTENPYEDPIDAHTKAEFFDTIFLSDLNSEAYWRSYNPNSHYIPHSYDPDKHFPSWARPKHRRFADWTPPDNGHDHVVYVGSGFTKRQSYLEEVDWSGVNLKVYGHWPLLRARDDIPAAYAPVAPKKDSPLIPYVVEKMVENTFTARLYRGSAIGINMHRTERWSNNAALVVDDGEAYSMGPRGVEYAACGLFQVSDPRQEIIDVFGDSVPIHRSPEELGVLVRKYLADPVRRQELAVQQHEAIKGRTFQAHTKRMLELAA